MVDTFELVEIDTADTLEELCEKEIGYILSYNSYYMDGNGYNMTLVEKDLMGSFIPKKIIVKIAKDENNILKTIQKQEKLVVKHRKNDLKIQKPEKKAVNQGLNVLKIQMKEKNTVSE